MRLGESPSDLTQGFSISENLCVDDDENAQKRSLEDPMQALQSFYEKLKRVSQQGDNQKDFTEQILTDYIEKQIKQIVKGNTVGGE